MKIQGKDLITEFVAKNERAEVGMSRWISVVEAAVWKKPSDMASTFNNGDKVKVGYIFNISGNNYRIHASVAFSLGLVTVLQVGTHKEYDGWDL
jgi:mRNA interferase HigB